MSKLQCSAHACIHIHPRTHAYTHIATRELFGARTYNSDDVVIYHLMLCSFTTRVRALTSQTDMMRERANARRTATYCMCSWESSQYSSAVRS